MYRLFYTPTWFNGWDLIVEAIGLIVVLLIAAYSYKVYRISKENRYAYLALAFLLVVAGTVFKLITSGILYYGSLRAGVADVLLPLAGADLQFADLYYRGAFFLQMVCFLGAWLLLFFLSQKSRERLSKLHELSQILLFVYLIVLISLVANFKYFVFYLTSLVILALTVLNYYKNYLTTKGRNSFLVTLAFLCLMVANIFFVFVFVNNLLYVIGEGFLLLGFLVLLFAYTTIIHRSR